MDDDETWDDDNVIHCESCGEPVDDVHLDASGELLFCSPCCGVMQ